MAQAIKPKPNPVPESKNEPGHVLSHAWASACGYHHLTLVQTKHYNVREECLLNDFQRVFHFQCGIPSVHLPQQGEHIKERSKRWIFLGLCCKREILPLVQKNQTLRREILPQSLLLHEKLFCAESVSAKVSARSLPRTIARWGFCATGLQGPKALSPCLRNSL